MLQYPYQLDEANFKVELKKIHTLGASLTALSVSSLTKSSIFHRQVLKSSLFSARIEGNTLTLPQVLPLDLDHPKEKNKLEINNVLKALQHLSQLPEKVGVPEIQKIHQDVMQGLIDNPGRLRVESSAIFDQFGNIVYVTPEPAEMRSMLELWLQNCNQTLTSSARLVELGASHYYFEKSHPFIDGNGRTGRVFLQYQLAKTKLFGEYIVPIDEYFEQHKSSYYRFLEKNSRDVGEFTKFLLDGLVWSLETLIQEVKTSAGEVANSSLQTLLPRRQELVQIVADHPYCTMDALRRRFPSIPMRTLAYDVSWLVQHKYLIKHGSTRGVTYSRAEV